MKILLRLPYYLLPTAFLLITVLAGCTTLSNKDQSAAAKSLESQVSLRFSDMPIPAGCKLLSKDSYSFESSGVRVGLLRYQGKAKVEQIVNFYKEQMPMYNWTLLNMTEYGECVMNFDRDTESCIINITPKGSTSFISISFGPKSQVSAKKTRQAVK